MRPRRILALIILVLIPQNLIADESDLNAAGDQTPDPAVIKTAPLLMFQQYLLTRVSVSQGKELLFLIDNGCYYTMVESEHVADNDFRRVSEKKVNSAGRRNVPLEIGELSRIRLGELEIEDEMVTLSPLLHDISKGIGRNVHGVIGMRTLSRYLTTFDFASGRIIFRLNGPQARQEIIDQPGMIVVLPCKPTPISRTNKHLFAIEMTINGVPVDAIVDLGFSGGILTNFDPWQLDLDRYRTQRRISVAIAGLVGEGWMTWARRVEIDGHQIDGVEAIYVPAPDVPRVVIVGVEFLKRFEVTFDYQNQELILRQRPN